TGPPAAPPRAPRAGRPWRRGRARRTASSRSRRRSASTRSRRSRTPAPEWSGWRSADAVDLPEAALHHLEGRAVDRDHGRALAVDRHARGGVARARERLRDLPLRRGVRALDRATERRVLVARREAAAEHELVARARGLQRRREGELDVRLRLRVTGRRSR